MGARHAGRRLLVGLAALSLLAGCAASATSPPVVTSTPTALPMATATPAATPVPSPTPTAYGPVAVVTGTNICPGLNPDWTTDPDGTQHVRDVTVECTDKTDDPRVSGTHTASWNMDVWGNADQGVGAGVQWGTVRLENAGGAWEGRLSGVYSSARGDSIVIWYKGTGDYAGLTYFALITGGGPWKIQGQIFPGSPPTP